jgi:clan AA aspartic protease (TIGR02281 family)
MRALIAIVFVTAFVATIVAQMASLSTARHASPARTNIENSRAVETVKPPTDSPQFSSEDGSIALDRAGDGHFYAEVRINGNPVHMLIDTGASGIALSRGDAQSAGLATSIGMNDVVGEGADGAVRGENVKLDRVELGPLAASGLDAVVLNSGQQSLLGQSFLSKFSSVQIEGDRMVLR